MLDSKAATPQPAPHSGKLTVIDYVLADMTERAAMGVIKHGMPLQTHNGRDALWDAYQEAMDLCMYLRQAILERDAVPEAFRVEVINKRYFVMFRHTRLGEIAQDTDGEFVFFPKPQRESFVRSWLMKAIAAELDKLNSGQETA